MIIHTWVVIIISFYKQQFYEVPSNLYTLNTFTTQFRWPLVVVDRWTLFRGKLCTKIAWKGFRVIVVDKWLLFGVGC